jgi:class 3 adenylate cyclase
LDVRVRIGDHTGEAAIAQDDYIDLDVHRAARIFSAANGGQMLISSSTRELVAGDLPQDSLALSSTSPDSRRANEQPPAPNRPSGLRTTCV